MGIISLPVVGLTATVVVAKILYNEPLTDLLGAILLNLIVVIIFYCYIFVPKITITDDKIIYRKENFKKEEMPLSEVKVAYLKHGINISKGASMLSFMISGNKSTIMTNAYYFSQESMSEICKYLNVPDVIKHKETKTKK